MKLFKYVLITLLLITQINSLEAIQSHRTRAKRAASQLNWEVTTGQKELYPAMQAFGGPYTVHPEIEKYVQQILTKLVTPYNRQNMPFEVKIVNSSIPNAVTLPGGKIVLTRGLLLLAESESELASVLSHEIHHALANHALKAKKKAARMNIFLGGLAFLDGGLITSTVGRLAGMGALASSGRACEIECDMAGLTYMTQAGYDPRAMERMQKKFLHLERSRKRGPVASFFASHPPSGIRLKNIQKKIAHLPKPQNYSNDQFQKILAPLIEKKQAYVHYESAKRHLERGSYSEAIKEADKAIAIEPNEAIFYLAVGNGQYYLGNQEAADRAFTLAGKLNPYFDHSSKIQPYLVKKLEQRSRSKQMGAQPKHKRK